MDTQQSREPSVHDQSIDCASRLENIHLQDAPAAAAAPTEKPKGWTKLPSELRTMILQNICSTRFGIEWGASIRQRKPHPRLAPYARVCREWQWHFETVTFRSLTLHQIDLDRFQHYVARQPQRLGHLRWIHLRVALLQYECPRCQMPENGQEQADNNEIFAAAVRKFFGILAGWCGDREMMRVGGRRWPLELELSAYARSDWAHSFKALRYRANGCQSGRRPMARVRAADYDDRWHGWDRGARRAWAATRGECLRVLGGGLKIQLDDGARNALPAVPIVSSFLIRRQFYRRFEAVGCLDLILAALPNLRRFRYEPWGALPSSIWPSDPQRQLEHYGRLMQILGRCCPRLDQVSLYEDFEDLRGLLRLPLTEKPQDAFVGSVGVGALMADTSQRWKTAHLSFLVEAFGFFNSFWPGVPAEDRIFPRRPRWDDLLQLCLTSDLLSPSAISTATWTCSSRRRRRRSRRCRGCSASPSGWRGTATPVCSGTLSATAGDGPGSHWPAPGAPASARGRGGCGRTAWHVQYLNLRARDMGGNGALLPLMRDVGVAAMGSQMELITHAINASDLAGPWRRSTGPLRQLNLQFRMHIKAHRPGDPRDGVVAEEEEADEFLDVEYELFTAQATHPRLPAVAR
ncbi:amine oxidase [Apiospora marii]|uniref:Amine oxidase n=1 Tax=Apiospora marii TaxID=335849 RepID=A0ABR1SD01_9PEZI